MIRFENEIWFYALLLIPLIVVLYWLTLRWRQNTINKSGDVELVAQLVGGISPRRQRLKLAIYLAALFFIIIGLANPQIGTKLEKVQRQGVDVMIAIDVSTSMLAEDVQPNRLERSKQLVSRLIDNLKDDRIGIIVFAGNAYLQMPLTIDYAAAKLFLKSVNTDIVPTQGTSVADAIDLAINNFNRDEKNYKVLLLITDGEDHEQGAIDLMEEATNEGMIIHTLGVGSEDGAKIPVYNNRGQVSHYKQDKHGQEVVSKLNTEFLKELAKAGRGNYFRMKGERKEIASIVNELNNMEKKDFDDRIFTDYEDQFQYFILAAIVLLIINILLSDKSRGWLSRFKLFDGQ